MAKERKSGIDFVGDIAWGTHMCQFYKTKQDLLEVLVPYFYDGLKNSEFCVWVTSDFLNKQEATAAMQKAMPNFPDYLAKGQMEIFPYTEWYVKDGKFDLQKALEGWVEKHNKALAAGFAGIRVTGNPSWLSNKKEWSAFAQYEAAINKVIDDYKMLVLCTYSLDKCDAEEIIDVVANHKFGMIKRSGKWALIENSVNKKIEETLRKTENKFIDLYSSMMEGVAFHEIVYDKATGEPVDYVIVDVNPSFEKITGLRREKAIGKKATELYGTKEPPNMDVYAQVASSRKPHEFSTYLAPMDKHFTISCTSSSKGKFTTVFHDISEHKKAREALEKSERRYHSLFENSLDGIFLIKPDTGTVLAVNPQACQMFGMSEEEIKQLGRDAILVKDDRFFSAYHEREKTGKWKAELSCRRKDGSIFEADIASSLFLDSDGTFKASMIIRDITERKKAEEEIQNYSKNLEKLVEERTKQLKDAERLATIGATAGMVGHDIRNPLQAMISDVYLLESDLDMMPENETKQGLQESLVSIEKNIGYINKIVSDLQDYARPLNPEYIAVDLSEVVNSIFQTIEIPNNIKLSIDIKSFSQLKTDPMFVRRALTNLINNAVQAMPKGGKLEVASAKRDDKMFITVSDTGVGIPEEVKAKLFTPMMTTKSKGQGLGLAVVKRLIEALNGTITFESQEGKGTKFTLTLPI